MSYFINLIYDMCTAFFKFLTPTDTGVLEATHYFNPVINPILTEETDLFNKFCQDDKEVTKAIFAINNIHDVIHHLLFFDNSTVCELPFQIRLTKGSGGNYDYSQGDLDKVVTSLATSNNDCRYVYIRVNLCDGNRSKGGSMDHVNCIIIDKHEKYILMFEPTFTLRYDTGIIKEFFGEYIYFKDYKYLEPSDIGYTYRTRLQKYDTYCQTYTLLVFVLIISNPGCQYNDFSDMFGSLINNETIGHFLFWIYKALTDNGYSFDGLPRSRMWTYPTNSMRKVVNAITLGRDQETVVEEFDLTIEEGSDDVMVVT